MLAEPINLPVLKSNIGGVILYEGPSMLDGSSIALIATLKTSNQKTGDLIQTWILRSDKTPVEAVASGDDISICGNCKHRGKLGKHRSCYVNIGQAPYAIYRAYQNKRYQIRDYKNLEDLQWLNGRKLRCGSYGDPVAVPYDIWESLTKVSDGWTGYTHQWKICDPAFKNILMASVDSEDEYNEAKSLGWRTFRVMNSIDELLPRELNCPASKEKEYSRTCSECLACSGTRFGKLPIRAGDVGIVVHGSKAKLSAWNQNKQVTLDQLIQDVEVLANTNDSSTNTECLQGCEDRED